MKQKLTAILAAEVIAVGCLPSLTCFAADEKLVDSGIDYTESTETILNPGMGYTSTLWYKCEPNNTPVHNPTGALVLMFIDIGKFSSGMNCERDADKNPIEGTGVDYPLDDAFFAGLRRTFENCRKNGCTIALRFRYDENGTTNPEPATYEKMLEHVYQIRDSGILEEYKDILMYVESGLVGCYGEQWGGKYCSIATKGELLDLWLDVVPDGIPVTVRTPNIFASWAGIKTTELADWVSEPNSLASRVGLYNDGYMGSNSDLGTYGNREIETTWLHNQTTTSYYGGEFSGNLEFTKQYDTYLPENAIPEMYYTHLSYINSNIYGLYKDYIFDEATYPIANVDNSAYNGQNVWKFMRDHLGYRFVLRDSDLSESVPQGGDLQLSFSVENTGFANPIRPQKAELILEKDGNYIRTEIDADSRKWASCSISDMKLDMHLPSCLETGKWNAYLKLSVGNNTTSQLGLRSVRFANEDVWNDALGANYLGSFAVSEGSSAAAYSMDFSQKTTSEVSAWNGQMYSINGICNTDGILSQYGEAAEDRLIAEVDGQKLYIWNDEKYFYVSATIKNTAVSPVYNIQLKNLDNDTWYWLYFASNGAVYFNNGSYEGSMMKYTEQACEFRIPLGEMMGLQAGTKLEYVRVFLQDMSITNWPSCGSVKSGECSLNGSFTVYSVPLSYPCDLVDVPMLSVETALEGDVSYVWYQNGKLIAETETPYYQLSGRSNEQKIGDYTVKIITSDGMEQTVDVLHLTVPDGMVLRGDVNGDGAVTMADLVLLQKYLMTVGRLSAAQGSRADLNGDGSLTAADMTLLKQLILK